MQFAPLAKLADVNTQANRIQIDTAAVQLVPLDWPSGYLQLGLPQCENAVAHKAGRCYWYRRVALSLSRPRRLCRQ